VRPWLAVLLTCACVGLGHLYVGRERRGLVFFLLTLLVLPALGVVAMLPPSRVALGLLLGLVALAAVTMLAAVVDAWRCARGAGMWPLERRLWSPGVVTLFLTVGLAFPLGAAVTLRTWCVEAFRVASGSMEPTLLGGDRILVDKIAYLLGTPRRGDVVVFRREGEDDRAYIKRVVGLPGERVRVVGDVVFVNGTALPEAAAPEHGAGAFWEGAGSRRWLVVRPASPSSHDAPEVLIPEDAVYLMGDRRGGSKDSRIWGPVPVAGIVGAVVYVYWPADSWSRFGPIR
jgi:signal peptidase I